MSRYDGIDYSYVPDSYWVDSSIRQSILRNIKGAERRKLIDEALGNGNFDLIEDEPFVEMNCFKISEPSHRFNGHPQQLADFASF